MFRYQNDPKTIENTPWEIVIFGRSGNFFWETAPLREKKLGNRSAPENNLHFAEPWVQTLDFGKSAGVVGIASIFCGGVHGAFQPKQHFWRNAVG